MMPRRGIIGLAWGRHSSLPCAQKRRGRQECLPRRSYIAISVGFIAAILVARIAGAQNSLPPILHDVGIDQHLDAQIPTDLHFRDEAGHDVQLKDYFGKRPVILSLVYYQCPMLCTTVLNELAAVLNVVPASIGEQFDVLTVSFDPRETPELAAQKKQQYLHIYRRPHGPEGWHFLTGDQASITSLTQAVGFRYVWDDKFQQFAHASGIIVLTPGGKVSRYFFGIQYAPKDISIALADAREQKIGSLTNTILSYCFHYDPSTGRYSLIVLNLVKVGAVLTMAAFGMFWVYTVRRQRNFKFEISNPKSPPRPSPGLPGEGEIR